MKKTLFILTVLALGVTSCDKEKTGNTNEQPGTADGSQPVVYSVIIPASLGADTKAVTYNSTTGGLDSRFQTTDNIVVYNKTKECLALKKDGEDIYLHPDDNAKTANLVGGLTFYNFGDTYYQVEIGDVLQLMYNTNSGGFEYSSMKENPDNTFGQKGTLAGLSYYDYALAEVQITSISGNGTPESLYTLTTTPANFTNVQSMFKLTFTGMPGNFNDTDGYFGINNINVHSAKNKLVTDYYPHNNGNSCLDLFFNLGGIGGSLAGSARKENGAGNVAYAALRFLPLDETETDEITFTMETTAGDYIAKKTSPVGGFQNGKYYTSTIEAYPKNVDLSSVTTTDGNNFLYHAARDGQVLTTSAGFNGYVTIEDGATVTLNDSEIDAPNDCDHAAIHCLGSANIIVSGTDGNHVYAGSDSNFPGIYVPHNASGTEYTLTINGTGTLHADGTLCSGAGIGGGYDHINNTGIPCGNIMLSGATISVEAGQYSAGIGGGGYSSCGNITLNGANIKFAKGASGAAGIGSGYYGTCGNITISSGYLGENSGSSSISSNSLGAGIGCGNHGKCGTITITSGITHIYVKKDAGCYIGGAEGNYEKVIIDGVELTYSQLHTGINSNAGDVFPNLNSEYHNNCWRLWK